MNPTIRPCFLVVDPEHSGSISTRKLVIETAKMNVITAYSGAEATATLRRFSGVDGVVLDAGIKDVACADLIIQLKDIKPDVRIVVVARPGHWQCEGADQFLENYDPKELLTLLRGLEPDAAARIKEHEAELMESDN
jgi:response regulator RpfG family c-di-GMP phosphodiesterase